MSSEATDFTGFDILLTPSATTNFRVDLPVLGGAPAESLFAAGEPAGQFGRFQLYRTPDWLLGAAELPAGPSLEAATLQLYQEMLAAVRGWHLARVWNYVPAINEAGAGGLENYRAFSRARSLAFETEFGGEFRRHAPAASAVGANGQALAVVFAAGTAAPRYFENPRQIPAYHYPPAYGPRAPTFARASLVALPDGAVVFVSGTSAIRGHQTVAPHDTAAQLACTLENLREIFQVCERQLPGCTRAAHRHFKVYLRHAADHPPVAAALEAQLLRPEDQVTYLRADICRRELNIEIEATLHGPPELR